VSQAPLPPAGAHFFASFFLASAALAPFFNGLLSGGRLALSKGRPQSLCGQTAWADGGQVC